MKSMYARKLKRLVDPNAPPRPNLFSHEKSIKEARVGMDEMRTKMSQMERQISLQEERIRALSNYVDQLRNYIAHSRSDLK